MGRTRGRTTNKTHALRQGTILMLNRPLNRMTVGSQACAVSVVVGNVRGTGSIKGLNINQQIGLWAIKVLKYNVRDLPKPCPRTLHPCI